MASAARAPTLSGLGRAPWGWVRGVLELSRFGGGALTAAVMQSVWKQSRHGRIAITFTVPKGPSPAQPPVQHQGTSPSRPLAAQVVINGRPISQPIELDGHYPSPPWGWRDKGSHPNCDYDGRARRQQHDNIRASFLPETPLHTSPSRQNAKSLANFF